MTNTTISPFVVGNLEEVELSDGGKKRKLWKKEILPNGTRQYKGQTLDFSKINPSCVEAFNAKAFDSVPFVLALADNQHPGPGQEAQNLEGDLEKLELSSDGRLFGYFDLADNSTAIKAIQASKGKFGVSGRIEVDYVTGDTGKKFDYALSHVCGTTRPHIKGMAPWEAVNLSEEEKANTIDFSTEVIDEVETGNEAPKDGNTVAVEIDKSTLDVLLQMAKDHQQVQEALAAQSQGQQGGSETAQLSEADTKRIELAEEAARKGFELAEKAQIELAETRWSAKRAELVREGVPPVVLTAAEKVLKSHKPAVIQLSDTESINATDVIYEILNACKGVVNLSEETGHGVSGGGNDDASEFETFEKDFFENFRA